MAQADSKKKLSQADSKKYYVSILVGDAIGLVVGIAVALIADLNVPVCAGFGLALGSGIGLAVGIALTRTNNRAHPDALSETDATHQTDA